MSAASGGRGPGRDSEKAAKGARKSEQKESEAGGPAPTPDAPAAGPHAKPELTNTEATPGAGLLPDPEEPEESANSTSS